MGHISPYFRGNETVVGFRSVLQTPIQPRHNRATHDDADDVDGPPRFKQDGIHCIPAAGQRFVPSEAFTLNKEGVGFYLDDRFRSIFLDCEQVIDLGYEERSLVSFRLLRPIKTDMLITRLGGESVALTYLAELHHLLIHQARGGKGALLMNRYPNIFHCRDAIGKVHAIAVRWCKDAFELSVPADSFRNRWAKGCRVFAVLPK